MNAVGLNMPPQGTIPPGTTIQLGKYTVLIDRYIAEGGFAHVYLATLTNGGGFPVVVKRIAAPDKERLAIVNSEIETMKRLGKHKNIVEYMDSCMGKLEGGGYEVLILMEYCGGGPVIDLMNRRLQHRLTEPEILKIFSNVCEAVAYMHYSDPPILHRDIKVENILLSNNDYKLCDFGSATTNILRGDNIPRNVKDIQLLEEEINNHTTLQYRAPEMLDLYMRRGIDEKIDIWALGVLLYKLCFYTTPFEEQGQLAILNVRYTVPDHPVFSPALIGLFQCMLKEDPKQRPNIYQVMQMTSALRGLPCPIHNIYPDPSFAPASSEAQLSATADILSNSTMQRPMDILPSIEPMRRGRPTRSPVAVAPPMHANDASQGTFAGAVPQSDFSSGFDDSFGQFTASDPASQFSKIPPSGDAFDFVGSTPASDCAQQKDLGKRFTLDFETVKGNDEFGFEFSTTGNSNVNAEPAKISRAGPRPPSISSGDLLLPESSPASSRSVNGAAPAQLSGSNGGVKAKPTADDLFFGSSAGTKFESSEPRGSGSGTPSSFGSLQQAPVGLSSPGLSSTGSPSGMSKPLLGSARQQSAQLSGHVSSPVVRPVAGYQNYQVANGSLVNKDVQLNGTGNTRSAGSSLSAAASPSLTSDSAVPHGHRSTNSTGISNKPYTGSYATDLLSAKMQSMELLQRQQLEQLGKFSIDRSPGISSSPHSAQGKAKVLDPSKTLDGLRSLDAGSTNGSSAGSAGGSAIVSPSAPAPRSVPAPAVTASSGASKDLPYLDRKGLAKRDMDAELKLIELQQKEFERQQQELLTLQRLQLEEQQRKHREQQELLQKQQQQQIQLQHEKWQERKRMLAEQEQLTQRQVSQQKDLEQQHQSQQELQQQQQQQQQQRSPAVSAQAPSAYRRSIISDAAPAYPNIDLLTSSARSSFDDQDRLRTSGYGDQKSPSVANASPVVSSSLISDFSTTPTVPVKSSRRVAANGAGTSMTAPSHTAASAKARRMSVTTLPPGQKPELLPKPTRFRMKDGIGNLAAGEEEAFKKKFPSAELEDDLGLSQSQTTFSASSSGYGSPHETSGRLNSSQYQTPSQRARGLRNDVVAGGHGRYGAEEEEEEEEEEETLIRSRRRQYTAPAPTTASNSNRAQVSPPCSLTKSLAGEDSPEEESTTPMESVRERVQRMNRVGRVV
ncbi:hypothetical protein BGZ70_010517 [Mortierella alpina]|uniref:non-specific serine/threonine protein kinase n=1 Tax=Mortierella alpina TaxID=64518 RepID=A0A9P6M673_MORAP|nr:hypothetical protein BGZ70_010517 [Mortierella alpina]